MRGTLTITFDTNDLMAVTSLKNAILSVAPYMVDNVSVTEQYDDQENFVQWVVNNFHDLKVKHNRPTLTVNRVGIARLYMDERKKNLKVIVEEIKEAGF